MATKKGMKCKAPVRRRTYGAKPRVFHLDNVVDDADKFMIGSEVGEYLGMGRGWIYQKYPLMWRKLATLTQRRKILMIVDPPDHRSFATNVTLLKATEVEEIIEGRDLKYRAVTKTVKAAKKHSTLSCPLVLPQECQISTSENSKINDYFFLTPDCMEFLDTIEQAQL